MSLRFSLRDLLLSVSVLGVLFGLLPPYLHKRWQASRLETCQSNLRQLGVGMLTFADRDRQKRLSSGPAEYLLTGANGWLSDMQSVGVSASDLLCPSNNVRGLASLNDAITNTDSGTGTTQAVVDAVAAGLNSNYSQSWFAARGTLKRSETRQGLYCQGDQRTLAGAYAGLRLRLIEMSLVRANTIPIVGDAACMDFTALNDTVGNLEKGSLLGKSFGDGPVCWQPDEKRWAMMSEVCTVGSGRDLSGCLSAKQVQFFGVESAVRYLGPSNRELRHPFQQSNRNFAPAHFIDGKCLTVFLFADGSVGATDRFKSTQPTEPDTTEESAGVDGWSVPVLDADRWFPIRSCCEH